MEQRKDRLTNEPFTATRINNFFASKFNRIKYWNNVARNRRHQMAAFNQPLHRNYLILQKLLHGKKEAVFPKQYLLGAGYNFGVFTHVDEYEGKPCYGIYRYLIVIEGGDQIKFIRND